MMTDALCLAIAVGMLRLNIGHRRPMTWMRTATASTHGRVYLFGLKIMHRTSTIWYIYKQNRKEEEEENVEVALEYTDVMASVPKREQGQTIRFAIFCHFNLNF